MATIARQTTWASAQILTASALNTEFDNIVNAWNNHDGATSSWTNVRVTADPTVALAVATKQYVDVYAGWKRPRLVFIDVANVDVENNTGTANETEIIFSDGNRRAVTENTATANKYRRFTITATAEFSSGTEDSGLRSGLTEAANTWYAIYAVKSSINTANFVLAGDTTLPLQANFATLNTRYGTDGWVYLGLIRNGTGGVGSSDILNFYQVGNLTVLQAAGNQQGNQSYTGFSLANSAASTSITWAYAAGTGNSQIPDNVNVVIVRGMYGLDAERKGLEDSGPARTYGIAQGNTIATPSVLAIAPANNGFLARQTTSGVVEIMVVGWFDNVLGVGSNPQL